MAEGPRRPLFQVPMSRVRPETRHLAPAKAGAHARDRVVPRNVVAGHEAEKAARVQRKARASRLAGHEERGALRRELEQPAQRRSLEVMQEEIGDDGVERRPRSREEVMRLGGSRDGFALQSGESVDDRLVESIGSINQMHFSARSAHPAGDAQHELSIAGAQVGDARALSLGPAKPRQCPRHVQGVCHEPIHPAQVRARALRARIVRRKRIQPFRFEQAVQG